MAILQVKDLSKTYGKGDTIVTALDGVSFSVEKGEFVAIIGASGSGKSTLMHLLGGVDRPTAGKVIIDGNEIYKSNESELAIFRRRNIGIIYQFYNLIPTLTAEENIMLPRLLDNRKPDKSKLQNILETIGLTDRAKHLPSELSGGQQQRVSAGRALINDPAIILADEPTGNLDVANGEAVISILRHLAHEQGYCVIVVTHNLDIAEVADVVYRMSDGVIKETKLGENK